MLQLSAIDTPTWELLIILTYFEDAEKEIMPKMLQEINWEKIKERILSEVQHYR